VEKKWGEGEEDVAAKGVVGNVDVEEGESEKEGAEGVVHIGTDTVVGEDPEGHGEEENAAKRRYEGEVESFNGEGLVDVNINRDGNSDSNWDGNMACVVESASDGEGWYIAQESTNLDYDEVRTEGGGSDFEWHSDELVSGSDIDEVNDDIKGYGSFPTFSMPKTWTNIDGKLELI